MQRWKRVAAVVVVLGSVVTPCAFAQGKGDAKAGEGTYNKAQCAKCHGDAGKGDGAQGQKLKDKPTDWTNDGGGLKGMSDQQVFDSIAKGGPAVGKSRAMPGSPKLSEQEVWNLVAYVKTLRK